MMARPIPAKVAKLLPMLGSTTDHEALAAVRAIGRVLDGSGLGFTDLAAAIPAGEGQDNVTTLSTGKTSPRPFDVYGWRHVFTPKQERRYRDWVRFCENRPGRLTDWERGFVANIAKLHGNLSIRQGDRLAVIVDRIEREGRRSC